MKAVILAGGRGTRIAEETDLIPKPMIEIGGKPIIWHVMKIFSFHGIDDFVICCGYRGYAIKEYFSNYYLHSCDITFDIANDKMIVHHKNSEPWRVTLINTGELTETGGRIKRIAPFLEEDTSFCLTYGDGVADIDLSKEIEFHRQHGKLATVLGVDPPGRFGALELENDQVVRFQEKPSGDSKLINGGFFVLSPACLDFIDGDHTIWEVDVLPKLAEMGQLAAYKHSGFWQPMDTLRDRRKLEALWSSGQAPWRLWD